jgi:hypothetical protein
MSRKISHRRFVAVAVVIVAGLGLGFVISHFRWEVPPWLVRETLPAPASLPANQPDTAESDPASAGPSAGKRALLVGVTTYDYLPPACHLEGPVNDVRLMRRMLQEIYQFPAAGIVSLTEDEGSPGRRPTRANIEREFRQLADQAREGDQIVILLAGHGARQPEADPPSPENPEPDGIDEIFLPADVIYWNNFPQRVPNAIVDDEIGGWLRTIIDKRAYVWIIFDCCHSGTMTRGAEVVREVPPEILVPREEMDKARERAAQRRETTRGWPTAKPVPFVPRLPSDYLVALYACRSHESTPEGPQPPGSPDSRFHGLLTYSLVEILIKSAESKDSLTYRELTRRLQTKYAGRFQGSPTPLVEGRGQDRIVLGTEQPKRSPLILTRDRDGYKVDAGDLYGLTPGSILAVDSSVGTKGKPDPKGHVRVTVTRPFDSTVELCAYEGSALVSDLAMPSACRPVFIDYGLRRFKVAIQAPDQQQTPRQQLQKAVEPLTDGKRGLVELVSDPRQADWLVRLSHGKVELIEASGNRPAFPLPSPENTSLAEALRQDMEKVYRARNLLALSGRFEVERYRGSTPVDLEVEVMCQKDQSAPSKVLPAPPGGWVFRPGDHISFRVHNKSPSVRVDVTLLIVGSDFRIHAFYPRLDEVGKSLSPGEMLTTPSGEINEEPPFGPEYLVVIAVPAMNPPWISRPWLRMGFR